MKTWRVLYLHGQVLHTRCCWRRCGRDGGTGGRLTQVQHPTILHLPPPISWVGSTGVWWWPPDLGSFSRGTLSISVTPLPWRWWRSLGGQRLEVEGAAVQVPGILAVDGEGQVGVVQVFGGGGRGCAGGGFGRLLVGWGRGGGARPLGGGGGGCGRGGDLAEMFGHVEQGGCVGETDKRHVSNWTLWSHVGKLGVASLTPRYDIWLCHMTFDCVKVRGWVVFMWP